MSGHQVNASIGLDTRDLGVGVSSALGDLTRLGGGLGRLARDLENAQRGLTMNADQIMQWRIENTKMSDAQRATLITTLKNNQAFRQLTAQIRESEAAEQRQKAAVEQILGSLKRQAQALGQTNAQLQINELRSNGATAAQIRQARAAQDLIAAHERLNRTQSGGGVGAMALGVAAVGGGTGLIKAIDDWTVFQNRLKLVHQSSDDVAAAQKGIMRIATETGASLSETATVYQRFASQQRELGLSSAQLVGLTETVSKAIALGGSSAESSAAALAQFGQALASGVLRGEEFNSVMEQAPGLTQALAKGLGVNVGQLRAMAADGKLTADVLVGSLQKMRDSVNTDFAKTNMTISESIEVLKTRWVAFVGTAGDSSGAANALGAAIRLLGENVGKVVLLVGALTAIKLTNWAVGSAAAVAQNVAAMIAMRQAAASGALANGINAAAVARTGSAASIAALQVTGFSGALNVLSVSARSSAVAMSGATARMGAMGAAAAPAVLAMAALASATTAIFAGIDVARGRSGDNWISDLANDAADALGLIDKRVDSIGTKIADLFQEPSNRINAFMRLTLPFGGIFNSWLFPIKQVSNEFEKQQKLVQAIDEKIGYKPVSHQIDAAGGIGQFKAQNLGLDDLKKSLADVILKYREQTQEIGKTKEELALLRLETEKETLLKKQKAAYEKEFSGQKNKDDLVAERMQHFAAQLEIDFQAAKTALGDFTAQTQKAERAERSAAEIAQKRAQIDGSIASLSEKLAGIGKTSDELERLKLASMGATEAQMRQVFALQTAISFQERQNAVNQSLLGLEDEIAKIGKSAKEIKLMDLEKQGATAAQLDYATALLDLQAAREKQFSSVGEMMQNAANVFHDASETQRSYISESWAKEKAKIDAYNAERDAEIAKARWAREQPKAAQAEDRFSESVGGFQAAVNTFSQNVAQKTDNQQAMQRIVLDLSLPSGKVLSGIVLAEQSFVESIKGISVSAMYNEIAKQAAAKS